MLVFNAFLLTTVLFIPDLLPFSYLPLFARVLPGQDQDPGIVDSGV